MSDQPSLLPVIDGRAVIAMCPVYHWDDRTEFVVVTAWDGPTPWVVRHVVVSATDADEPYLGSGEYHFSLASALRAFRERIPLA
jgi:hypothetical protein